MEHMDTVLGFVIGIFFLGRAIYPAPVRWGRRPWFVTTDRQGRIALTAFGGVFLAIGIVGAIS